MLMSDNSQNNKRIAKNTLMLYIRMILMMAVSLYTSRVILDALGVEDFGLYNIVGGIVVLFSFINNAMVTSTQRFLNYELGRNNPEEAQKVFSASLSIHFIIAAVFLILSESVGLWFLNSYIKIPQGREVAANWVYQFSVLASIFNIIRAPYNAAIIAHERMSFYAYVSIIETILKLLIVYLVYLFSDRLISYSAMIAGVAAIILFVYYIFCRRKFSVCKYKFEFDKSRYFSIASFSWWSLFGSFANVGSQQGLNILLNAFWGVTINAAMGVANQVNNTVYNFVSNFQTAFNPQIVKLYAAEEKEQFQTLVSDTSRYSYYLLFAIAFPIIVCCSDILQIWLKEVPEYSVIFCQLIIVGSLFDALSGPLWMSVYASGKLSKYQISISILLLSTLLFAYLAAKLGGNPIVILVIKVIVSAIIYVFRLGYCVKYLKIGLTGYLKTVIGRCFTITAISVLSVYLMFAFTNIETLNVFIKIIIVLLLPCISIYFIGFTSSEKNLLHKQIKKVCKKVFIK